MCATDFCRSAPLPPISLAPGAPVRVGLCITRQGLHAALGSGVYEGAYLASQEMAPLIGREIQVLVEEETADPRAQWEIIARFVRNEVLAVVGPMTYGVARSMLPLLDFAGICVLLPCIRNPDITRMGYKTVYRVDFDGGVQASRQAEYAMATRGGERIAIVHSMSPFWAEVAGIFRKSYKGTVTSHQQFPPGITTFRGLAHELRKDRPGLLYAAADEGDLIAMLLWLRDHGIQLPVLCCASLRVTDLDRAPGLALDQIHLTRWNSPRGAYDDFASRFRAAYGHEPGFYSPEAYDAVVAIAASLSHLVRELYADKESNVALQISSLSLPMALRRTSLASVTGRLAFDARGDRVDQGEVTIAPASHWAASPFREGKAEAPAGASSHAKAEASHRPRNLFYSYASADQHLVDRLMKHLAILKRQGLIREWHFREITAGKEWEKEIDSHLESAGIILLMVSADFLSSDYCYDIELKRAIERHKSGEAVVIPVILQPCDWQHPPLSGLQALPTGIKPVALWPSAEEGLADVARGVRKAIEELA